MSSPFCPSTRSSTSPPAGAARRADRGRGQRGGGAARVGPGAHLLDLCCGQGRHADASFDAVVNLFNAFGYLEDDAQDELVLAEVARVLAPGGRFLQELAHREALVRGWHDSDVQRTGEGLVVSRSGAWTCGRAASGSRYTLLHPDGRQTTRPHAMRLYSLTELAAMLDRAGLELLEVHGDLDGGPLELDSSFLVTLSGRGGDVRLPG
jgi:SAM-dependent methyltransferase